MNKVSDLNKAASNARADRLKAWVENHYESQQAFIDKFELNQGEISNIIQKKRVIGERKARKLEQQTDIPLMYLDGLNQEVQTQHQSQAGQSQGQIQVEPWKSHLMALEPWEDGDEPDPDEVDLPFFDDVSFAAGDGSFLIQVGMNAQRKLRFLRATLEAAGVRIEDAACAKNSGTSMEDLIRDGATIGIDISKAQLPIKDGKIYAMFHGGMLRIKYLYRLPGGGVRLRSHNRDEYEDEDLFGDKLNDFRVLGWVFWWSTVDRW